MSTTVLDMSMSIDGFIAGPNETPENGLGDGGLRLHDHHDGVPIFVLSRSEPPEEAPDAAGGTGIPVWVFDHARAVEAPRTAAAITSAARLLAGSPAGSSRTVD